MLREGMKVSQMTKKVGQGVRTGVVAALRGRSAEVRWDDGRSSIVSRESLQPVKR